MSKSKSMNKYLDSDNFLRRDQKAIVRLLVKREYFSFLGYPVQQITAVRKTAVHYKQMVVSLNRFIHQLTIFSICLEDLLHFIIKFILLIKREVHKRWRSGCSLTFVQFYNFQA